MKRRGVARVLAMASACAAFATFASCGGDEARPAPVAPVPPVTVARPAPRAESGALPGPESGETARIADGGGATDAEPPRTPPPEPRFGAGPVKPTDVHAFRLAAALRALRAHRSGVKVLQLMSVLPSVVEAKARTAVDPFADGEWLLVYGAQAGLPGANANVVRHARAEADVAKAIADAGFETPDGGPATSVRADLYGVRDVLLRPQPGTLALVPGDRAGDLGAALAKPLDPGVKSGELARVFIAEPAKLARMLPKEVVRANVVVKPAPDGGFDLAADAECGDAAACAATATSLEDFVMRQNSVMVRLVTRSILSGLVFRADGTKLRATLHATPDQVETLLSLTRAQLDLPSSP